MLLGIILAAAIGQQQQTLCLGGVDDRGRRIGAMIAVDEAAYRAASLELRFDEDDETSQPVGTAAVGRGTQARVLKPVELLRWKDGGLKPMAGYQVEILEGPLVGVRCVVSARLTYKDGPRELTSPPAPKTNVTLGPVALILEATSPKNEPAAVIVAGTVDELLGVSELEGHIAPDGSRLVDGPVMLAQVPPGTKATGLGVVERDGKPVAVLVKVLEGVAAGRVVYVNPGAFRVVESTKQEKPSTRQAELRRTAEKQKARRSARVRAGKAREAVAAAQQAKAQAEYQAALPFLLESQRIAIQRMDAAARAAYLQRLASSNERMAKAMEFKAGVPQTVAPQTYVPLTNPGPLD